MRGRKKKCAKTVFKVLLKQFIIYCVIVGVSFCVLSYLNSKETYADSANDDMLSANEYLNATEENGAGEVVSYPENLGSWLGDYRNSDKLYGTPRKNTYSNTKSNKDAGFVVTSVSSLFNALGDGIHSLLSSMNADIDQLIFGRLQTHNSINLFMFELTPGNPYGFVATIIYNVFAKVVFIAFILITMTKLAVATWGGSTPQKRQQLKSDLTHIIIMAIVVYLMPFFYDIAEFIRDIILKVVLTIVGTLSGGAGGIIDAIADVTSNADNIAVAMVYVGAVCVGVYFMMVYIDLTLSMMMNFILFPLIAALSVRDKSVFDNWLSSVVGALATPILDGVVFLTPMVLLGYCSNSNMGGAAKFVFTMVVFMICASLPKSRGVIMETLHLRAASNGFGSAIQTLAAARAIGGSLRKAAGRFGEAKEGISGMIRDHRMNKDMEELEDKYAGEESDGIDTDTPMTSTEDITNAGRKRTSSEVSNNSSTIDTKETDVYGASDFDTDTANSDVKSNEAKTDTTDTGNADTGNADTGNTAVSDPTMPQAYDLGGGNEFDAKVNDANAIAQAQNNIRGMNTQVNSLNKANAELELEKAELNKDNATDNSTLHQYKVQIEEARETARTTEDESVRADALEQVKTLNSQASAVQSRIDNRNYQLRTIDSQISANNAEKSAIQSQISAERDNIQQVQSNANLRQAQIKSTEAAKAKERQQILDKYASVSNMDSPEFRDISPERRAQLQQKANIQKAVRGTVGGISAVAGGAAGVAATTFGGVVAKGAGVMIGTSVAEGIATKTVDAGFTVAPGVAKVGKFAGKVVMTGAVGTVQGAKKGYTLAEKNGTVSGIAGGIIGGAVGGATGVVDATVIQPGARVVTKVRTKIESSGGVGSFAKGKAVNVADSVQSIYASAQEQSVIFGNGPAAEQTINVPLPKANMGTPVVNVRTVTPGVAKGNYANIREAQLELSKFASGTDYSEITPSFEKIFASRGLELKSFRGDKEGFEKFSRRILRDAGFDDTVIPSMTDGLFDKLVH